MTHYELLPLTQQDTPRCCIIFHYMIKKLHMDHIVRRHCGVGLYIFNVSKLPLNWRSHVKLRVYDISGIPNCCWGSYTYKISIYLINECPSDLIKDYSGYDMKYIEK